MSIATQRLAEGLDVIEVRASSSALALQRTIDRLRQSEFTDAEANDIRALLFPEASRAFTCLMDIMGQVDVALRKDAPQPEPQTSEPEREIVGSVMGVFSDDLGDDDIETKPIEPGEGVVSASGLVSTQTGRR